MRFSIYGRFLLDVERENGVWITYRVSEGRRVKVSDFIITSDVEEKDFPQFLDDIFHELSGPGDAITTVR
jgi:hypothetical protein